MFLFFDTETTGLPKDYRTPFTDLTSWPHLVQLAWMKTDDSGKEINTGNFIIMPIGFDIPKDASDVHGITTEIALDKGVPLRYTLECLNVDLKWSDCLVAHNVEFDRKVLGASLLRANVPSYLSKNKICTMKSSTNFCQLPGQRGYKWPKLDELYFKLFDRKLENAHDALVDVRACAKCFFELINRKVIEL